MPHRPLKHGWKAQLAVENGIRVKVHTKYSAVAVKVEKGGKGYGPDGIGKRHIRPADTEAVRMSEGTSEIFPVSPAGAAGEIKRVEHTLFFLLVVTH